VPATTKAISSCEEDAVRCPATTHNSISKLAIPKKLEVRCGKDIQNLRLPALVTPGPGAKISADPVQASPMIDIRDVTGCPVGEMPEPGTVDSSSPQVARTCSLSQGERTLVALGGERAGAVVMACVECRWVSEVLQSSGEGSRLQRRCD